VAAIVLRAIEHHCGDRTRSARSMHLRYLMPAAAGSIELHVHTLRVGRSVAAFEAQVMQAGKALCRASAVFGVPVSAVEYCDARMPQAPHWQDCAVLPSFVPVNERYEIRPALGGAPRAGERASGGGWIRPEQPRMPDALLMAALWDAWMPTPLYRRIDAQFGGAAPTVEASVYFRAQLLLSGSKPDGYYLASFESKSCSQGYFEESGEIWSDDGVLLVQSRQLALLY
jgi:acyl-CoA thioesterase